jgi:hypothetical protein
MNRDPSVSNRAAFTLIEATVAITFTALAGGALVLGTLASLETTHASQEQAIASALAQQLMDEALGRVYLPDSGDPYPTTIGPGGAELVSGNKGARFKLNDIGDYNGYRCQPPVDAWGIPLGQGDGAGGSRNPNFQAPANTLANWQQQVDVYYVSESDLTTALRPGQTSDYRAVEVRIMYINPNGPARQLAQLRRIVVYVPPLP